MFDDVFISPRTRDTEQEQISHENISSLEAGYILNLPDVKFRLSTYCTGFSNGMNVMTFYHDAYKNFMNYALYDISKLHYGIETGVEVAINSRFSITAAASIGNYFYQKRQQVTVSADNEAFVTERSLIYTKNYKVAGTPQEAYNAVFNYRSGAVYLGISASYFRQNWLAMNPLRRTYAALQDVVPESDQWKQIINQIELPDQSIIDFSAGTSFKVKTKRTISGRMIMVFVSINNLLNNQQIISGGYEQLRFDTESKNINRFPPKYFYAMGLNFSINLSLQL